MKMYVKCLAVAALWGVFRSLYFLSKSGGVPFTDILILFSFSKNEIILVNLIDMTMQFLPLFLFQILFGTCLYRHFCKASVYYFSRCNNRITWFLKESSLFYPHALLYPFIMVAFGTIVAGVKNQVLFKKESFILLIYYLLIYSLWLYFTTLLMNVVAIMIGSSLSFVILASVQMGFVLMLLLWEKVLPLSSSEVSTSILNRNAKLLQLNPVAHLVLTWHSSRIESVNRYINLFNIKFDLNNSILLFFILCILVISIGTFVVKRQDLIIVNKETGGVE